MLKLPESSPRSASGFPSQHQIPLDALVSPAVVHGVAYWTSLRGPRRFPARHALSVRDMAPFLRNVALIQVLNGGEDYMFRLVGDAHVEARGFDFTGETIRKIGATAPDFAARSYALYEQIRTTGEPYAIRGPMDAKVSNWRITHRECAFLPLGPRDDFVDYLFVVGVYALQVIDH